MAQPKFFAALGALSRYWSAFFHNRCLVGFPWFWPARSDDLNVMVDARRTARRQFGRGHHAFYRSAAQVLALIAWIPAVAIHLWEIRRCRGAKKVPVKRVPGAVWTAMRHNVLPGEYFAYALWHPDRKANIDHYLYSNEAARLFKAINRPSQVDAIGDKLAFYEMCRKHAIPTPSILAAFAPTGRLLEFESGSPPEHDLFVKPRLGFSGQGAERFRWQAMAFESDRGHRMRSQDLGSYLTARARTEKKILLVQPAVLNDRRLRIETKDALATARLVTGRSADGDILPIFGFIYFGGGNRITAQHGYVSLIDVQNGQLLGAPQDEWGELHPLANGWDNTYVLPEWEAVLRHTKVAHNVCCNFVFVGWDVAFTDHGPVLLEGNANWTADEYQSLSGDPLGHTRFADILLTHLTRSSPVRVSMQALAPRLGRRRRASARWKRNAV